MKPLRNQSSEIYQLVNPDNAMGCEAVRSYGLQPTKRAKFEGKKWRRALLRKYMARWQFSNSSFLPFDYKSES